MVEHSVAIEEGRRPAPARWDFAAGPREVIMDADINKIAVTNNTKQAALPGKTRENVALERASWGQIVKQQGAPQYINPGTD
jgi:hypothetical protein